jgi:hypothetical protein
MEGADNPKQNNYYVNGDIEGSQDNVYFSVNIKYYNPPYIILINNNIIKNEEKEEKIHNIFVIPYLEGIKIIDYLKKITQIIDNKLAKFKSEFMKLPETIKNEIKILGININEKETINRDKYVEIINKLKENKSKDLEQLITNHKDYEIYATIFKDIEDLGEIYIYDNMGVLLRTVNIKKDKIDNNTLLKTSIESKLVSRSIIPYIPLTYDDFNNILNLFNDNKDYILDLMNLAYDDEEPKQKEKLAEQHKSVKKKKINSNNLLLQFFNLFNKINNFDNIYAGINLYNDYIHKNDLLENMQQMTDDKEISIFSKNIYDNIQKHIKENISEIKDETVNLIIIFIKFFNRNENISIKDSLLNMLFLPIKLNETEKELSGGRIDYKQKYMKYKQKYHLLKQSLNK